MTLRDLLVISGLCLLTEDADEAVRLALAEEVVHLFGEDAFERLDAIEASNEESEEVMLQILRSLAVDQELLDVKTGIPARDAEIAALRKEIETLRTQQDTDKANALPPLNDDLITILGRPNFMCAQLADTLRSGGRDIAERAENEQAAVIHFLLGHYLADPIQWAEKASAALKAARKETQA